MKPTRDLMERNIARDIWHGEKQAEAYERKMALQYGYNLDEARISRIVEENRRRHEIVYGNYQRVLGPAEG